MLHRLPSLLLLACLSSPLTALAQQLNGRIVAATSGQPVAFATVGVKGKSIGTTSNETGHFAFKTPADLPATDSVIISCIGYHPLRLTVAQARQPEAVWRLREATHQIAEVKVRHGQLAPAVLGRRETGGNAHWTTTLRTITEVGADERGWEVATVLPIKRSCYLDAFHVYIAKNGFRPIRMRFVLYAVEDGKPSRQLLTDDVQFVIPQEQTGWTSLDLRSYNIHLPKGQTVAAGIQWLQGEKLSAESAPLTGPGAFPSVGHRVALRDKSQAQWRVLPINVSMYLDVQQYAE